MFRPIALVLVAFAAALAPGVRSAALAPPTPILVELFTSEGCSSCPAADALLAKLIETQPADGVEIIGLGEHVDYWDHQGWKDRFGSVVFTNRQRVYSRTFNIESIYTPQMVVDGHVQLVGSDVGALRQAIGKAAALPHASLAIEAVARADRIAVSVAVTDLPELGRNEHADVVVAVTEDRLTSDVRRGENHGRVLEHAAVVRLMQTVGEVASSESVVRTEITLPPGWQRQNLKIVALVQERGTRRILGAAARGFP